MTRTLSRRSLLTAAAAAPLAAATSPVFAGAPMMGAATTPFNRFKLGDYEVTTLLAASRVVGDPHQIFGLNVSEAEFAAVSVSANIPTNEAQFFFTPTVVNTGSELVLFDTGLNGEGIKAALMSAGYTADQVDIVVLTHMHPDHIGGMVNGGKPTFGNAQYVTGRVEFDAWAAAENAGFNSNVRPFAEQTTMLENGGSVASGITAISAFGHTPGHMVYRIESAEKQLIIGADFANHYVWSLAHPDWEVRFDMDKEAAAKTRRKLLDMMATDRLPFIGYHMPWPAVGYVETAGDGFRYVPASYQMLL